MMNTRILAATMLAALAPLTLSAQSNGDLAAAYALVTTPVGAFAPHITNAMLDDASQSTRIAFEYGKVNNSSANEHALGGRIDMGFGGGTDMTFEVAQLQCDGCSSVTTFGLGGGFRVGDMAMGSSSSVRGSLGLTGDVGYWSKSGTDAWTVAVGVPFSLIAKSGSVAFVPFVKPSLGWGRATFTGPLGGTSNESGTRVLIGGGVGLIMPHGLGATVGIQRVIIDNASNVIGADISWGF